MASSSGQQIDGGASAPASFSPVTAARDWVLGAAQFLSALSVLAALVFPIARHFEGQVTRPQITMVLSRVIRTDAKDDATGKVTPGQRLHHYELLNPGPGTLQDARLVLTVLCGDSVVASTPDATTEISVNPPLSETTHAKETPRQIVAIPAGGDKSLAPNKRIGIVLLAEGDHWKHENLETTWQPGQKRLVYNGNTGDVINLTQVFLWIWWAVLLLTGLWWVLYFFFFHRGLSDAAYERGFAEGRAKGASEAASVMQQTNPEPLLKLLTDAISGQANLPAPVTTTPPAVAALPAPVNGTSSTGK